jgi:conjugal transfer pilus assembly protein TraV
MDANTIRTIFGFLLAGAALSGCSTPGKNRPSCPAPDGVQCMSTLEVYEATNSADRVGGSSREKNAPTLNSASTAYGDSMGTRVDGDTLALSATHRSGSAGERAVSRGNSNDVQEPYREPAKVMRIFVSAWEDEQGDLHTPGFIFTEIESRRWSVGQPAIDSGSTFRLLEGLGEEAAKDSRAAGRATPDAGRPVRSGNQP